MNKILEKKYIRILCMCLLMILFGTKSVYASEYMCSVSIPVEIKLAGDQLPKGNTFEITLESVGTDQPMPEKKSLMIKDEEKVVFGPIIYNEPGDYLYTIYQKSGRTENFTYDSSIYTVTVRIINDDQGNLISEIWACKNDGIEKEEIIFENIYKLPADSVQTGDQTDVRILIILMMVSVIMMILMILWRRWLSRKYE